MLISRRRILQGGALAAVAAAIPFVGARHAYAQSASTFDYYIAPNGDDNNSGSLTSPWSITALNSKMSIYSGKRVGIVGDVEGVQTPIQYGTIGGVKTTLYSMMQTANAASQLAVIKINGGTSSASTYLGSCTSAGVYQAGWAIIDAANPSGGAAPVGAYATILGQPFYNTTAVPNPGYVTVDGLQVRNGNYAGMIFGDIQATQLHNVVIKNCQIYDCVCSTSAENPGGLFLGNTSGAQVLNCNIYNITTSGGFFPYGSGGITTYTAVGLIVTNCTITGCGYAIQNKDGYQYGTYSYNYFDTGTFGSWTDDAFATCIKSPIPGEGQTLTCHHNILIGGGYLGYGSDGKLIVGSCTFYNNTLYTPPSVTAGGYAGWFRGASSSAGPFNWYNNLVYYSAYGESQGGPWGCLDFGDGYGISGASVDYNYYGTGMLFGLTGSGDISLSSWQAKGYDMHSSSGGTPFSKTPISLTSSSFQIVGPATTAGRGGVACGALDGSGMVGYSSTPAKATKLPDAPTLKVA